MDFRIGKPTDLPWAVSGRYLVFAGSSYHPGGGWRDFVGRFYNLDECYRALLRGDNGSSFDWWQIVDATSGVVIEADRRRD